MSVKIMGLVWDLDIPQNEKFVLLAYADHADHDGGNMFPAVSTVARKTGYSERSIQRTTRTLVEKGYLVASGKGPKGTNKWKFGRGDILSGVTKETEGVTSETGGVTNKSEGVTSETGRGDIAVTPEPSLNHQLNHQPNHQLTTPKNTNINWAELKKDSIKRKKEHDKNKKDPVTEILKVHWENEPIIQMRERVETALRGRKPDWDSPRSLWNGYDKKLIQREKDTGETIEKFMEWFYDDDFRSKGYIYLKPARIDDLWAAAFTKTETTSFDNVLESML